MRAIRGAITVKENSKEEIIKATKELLIQIIKENKIKKEELISIIFTATKDLNRTYPAVAARNLGYKYIPLLCMQEMEVVDSLKNCIRVMFYINRDTTLENIKHVYLKGAKKLRPDLVRGDE